MNEPLIGVTFICRSLQVRTPWSARGCVRKASSSQWSYCRVLWGALRRVMSISPWARSSSCWGQSWALEGKGEEIKTLPNRTEQRMIWMKSLIVAFFFSQTGACTEIYCSSLWWLWARTTLISVSSNAWCRVFRDASFGSDWNISTTVA